MDDEALNLSIRKFLKMVGINSQREIERAGITFVNCTPSNFYPLVADAGDERLTRLDSLRCLVMAGEPIDMARLANWCGREGFRTAVVNYCGPTECTDAVSWHRLHTPLDYVHRAVPIGRPLDNCRLYVVDRNMAPLPVGVPGELCAGGVCVGAGYVNDEKLTAEKFVPNPFSGETPRTDREVEGPVESSPSHLLNFCFDEGEKKWPGCHSESKEAASARPRRGRNPLGKGPSRMLSGR